MFSLYSQRRDTDFEYAQSQLMLYVLQTRQHLQSTAWQHGGAHSTPPRTRVLHLHPIVQSAHAGVARASSLYRSGAASRCDATSGVRTFKRPCTESDLVFFGDDVSLLHIMDLVHENEKLHCNAHGRFVCFHELSPRCLRSHRVLSRDA